jgi:hypothetical protein
LLVRGGVCICCTFAAPGAFVVSERLAHELGNKDGLFRVLGSQSGIRKARGDLDGALALQKEAERLCRELGDKRGLQVSLTGGQEGVTSIVDQPSEYS